jgi:hypothetical protein
MHEPTIIPGGRLDEMTTDSKADGVSAGWTR